MQRVKAFAYWTVQFLAYIIIASIIGRTVGRIGEEAVRCWTVVCLHCGRSRFGATDRRFGCRLTFGAWLSGGRGRFGRWTVAILWPFAGFGFCAEQQRRWTVNQIRLIKVARIECITVQFVTKSAEQSGTVEHSGAVRLRSRDTGVIHRAPLFAERTLFRNWYSILASGREKKQMRNTQTSGYQSSSPTCSIRCRPLRCRKCHRLDIRRCICAARSD